MLGRRGGARRGLSAVALVGVALPVLWGLQVGNESWGHQGWLQAGLVVWSCAAAGVLAARVRPLGTSTRTLLALDTLWMAAAAWFLSWSLVIWPPARDATGLAPPSVVQVLPTFLVLTVAAMFLLAVMIERSRHTVVGVLASALASAASVAVAAASADGAALPVGRTLAWWLVWGAAAVAFAVGAPGPAVSEERAPTAARQVLVHLPVSIALWVSTFQNVIHDRVTTSIVVGIGFLTGALFVTREVASWCQASTLAKQLSATVDELRVSESDLKELVAEQRVTAERLRWAAGHDDLTGLPNRFDLVSRLDHVLAAGDADVALLFIDLDNFKLINDGLGHDIGDAVLQAVASRLHASLASTDRVARFGGDEFLVLLGDLPSLDDAMAAADRIRKVIARPISVGGAEFYVTASVGVTVPDADERQGAELVRRADAAMYRAKRAGRNRSAVVEVDHDDGRARVQVAAELHRAIPGGEFEPYFQPIIDLADGRLQGFEVLARWNHPAHGILGPDRFIEVAEDSGIIGDLGNSVLRRALAALAGWIGPGRPPPGFHLAVNASVREIVDDGFPFAVERALDDVGLSGELLWFEITETALMTDEVAAQQTLSRLRSLGAHLSVDDFGTGYGSLTYLRRFPVQGVKIDRSFVQGIGRSADDEAIVAGVVGLGHALGLTVVAEGIEEPHERDHLRSLGCDLGQGYLYGRPEPWPDAAERLRSATRAAG